jgi:two-component sensor histidine kinase
LSSRALGHLTGGAVILGAVIFIGVVGLVQEGRAEKALESIAECWPRGLVGRRAQLGRAALQLSPKAALALGLAAHELSTNAAKYGSLSAADGRVRIAWRVDGARLIREWRESGGPPSRGGAQAGLRLGADRASDCLRARGRSEISLPPEGGLRTDVRPAARAVASVEVRKH